MRERTFICIATKMVRNFAANPKNLFVMNLINFLTIALMATLPAAAACSSVKGESASGAQCERTVTITHSSYSGLSSANGIIVNYAASASTGASTVCAVSGQQEIVDRIEIDVTDGMLYIRTRDGRGFDSSKVGPVIVNVSGHPVNKFEASSGSAINVGSSLKTNGKFVADVSSGSVVNLSKKIVCSSFVVDMSSYGTVVAQTIEALKNIAVDGSSGGVFHCSDLSCNALEIDLSSGATVNLAGTAKSCEVDASSGAVARIGKVKVDGPLDVDASSGAIVELGSGAKASSSSGAIIRRK